MAEQPLQAFLAAVIVGIDVHQAIQGLASLREEAGIKIGVKQPDQHFEVLRFAVQFVVVRCPEFQDGDGFRMFGAERLELSGELNDLFIGKQAAFQDLQNLHRF